MMKGYGGKMLLVNLSDQKIEEMPLEEPLARNFLGSYGIGAKMVYELQGPGVDALGPENTLGFVTGPFVGTPVPYGVRYQLVGKSPLTHTWGDASSGGSFAPQLKRAGYDAVFFKGISEKPVYLWINDGKAELRDASHLWGKDIFETEDLIREELGGDRRMSMSVLGPSGEKQALIACPITDKGNAPGRSGLGAVMGAKKVKAVVALGSSATAVADEEKVIQMSREAAQMIRDNPGGLEQYGTCGGTGNSILSGDCPVKNWIGVGEEEFENPHALSGESVIKYETRKITCRGCPTFCNGLVKVESGPYAIEEAQKPEYETLGAFGGMCLNNNLESIIMCNDICNRYGIDTISAGCTVAFAIECYENGIFTKNDTDGLELTWGNHASIVALTEKIAKREGIGDLLADGVKVASEKIGQGSEEYAVHSRGQELPMHDPRLSQTREAQLPVLGIMYQIDATPGRHTAQSSNRGRAQQSSGLCSMGGRVFRGEKLCEFLTAVTGIEYTENDLEEIGERVACIRQAFNLREGLTPKDFKLHGRVIGDPPLERGPLAGITLDMDTATRDYFEGMGWDPETGKPNKERLMELGGFEDVIADLY